MALVIRREDDGPGEVNEVLEPFDASVREYACQWEDPCCLRQPANQANRPFPVPHREIYRFVGRLCRGRVCQELLQVTDARDLGEASFVDSRLETILERDHEFHAFE